MVLPALRRGLHPGAPRGTAGRAGAGGRSRGPRLLLDGYRRLRWDALGVVAAAGAVPSGGRGDDDVHPARPRPRWGRPANGTGRNGLTPERVGIASIGTYFPAGYQTSVEIAAATGIPRGVIETKFGLRGKHIASPDEHVSQMAAAAARPLLAGGEAAEVDVLIYFGSAHKDYHLWSVAPKIQALLGLRQAFTLELMDTSACGPVALKVARDLLVADDRLRAVLLVGASRESHVIDYRNERSRFAFNFADGAAAAVVTRGPQTHEILASAIITDGAFAA